MRERKVEGTKERVNQKKNEREIEAERVNEKERTREK